MRYRYVNEVFWVFRSYLDEEKAIDFWVKEGHVPPTPFYGEMDFPTFYERNDAIKWLASVALGRQIPKDKVPERPKDEVLLAILKKLDEDGNFLLDLYNKRGPANEMKTSMRKTARKEIACAAYYKGLIESGFFDQEELKRTHLFRIIK